MVKHMRPAILAALALIISACASSRSLDKSVSDFTGNAELKGSLFTDRSHDYSDIDITLYEGRLMLTGSMRSEVGRTKLIENAWTANGVDQVIDEIFIGDKTSIGQGFADARIDQTLRTRLIASEAVSGRFKIAVSNGVVYLIGDARDQNELETTLAIASNVSGVGKVVNHVNTRAPLPSLISDAR